jgi:TPR repeat protein
MRAPRRLIIAVILATAPATSGGEIDGVLAKAKEGDALAQLQAAEMFSKGEGVARNAKSAAEWYVKAAEQGNAEAQLSLGSLYLGGKGLPKNSLEAAKWFLLAAEQGKSVAQIQMARMHLAGAGVVKDDVEAWKWASLAAEQGDKQAKNLLAFLGPRMTAEQIDKAKTLVRDYLAKRPEDGTPKNIPLVAPPIEP